MDADLFDGDDDVDTFDIVTVARLERLLLILRQTIARSGGGTVLHMHDKDDFLHFSLEGFLSHPSEKAK